MLFPQESNESGARRRFALPTRRKRLFLLGGLAVAALLCRPGLRSGRSAAQGAVIPPPELLINGKTVSGLVALDNEGTTSEVIVYDNGSGVTHLIPGALKPGKLTLSRAWTGNAEFFNWRKTVIDGKVDRRSISIIFHNDAGTESRFNFYHCWPTKWVGPALNARSSGHANEKLEISWETMELKAG